jgi:hypothetical protein
LKCIARKAKKSELAYLWAQVQGSVMLVQLGVENTISLQGHGVQDYHLIICEAVGIDPAWYHGVANGAKCIAAYHTPLNLGFTTSEGINGARLPHFGRQTPPGLCRIYAPLYMAQVIGRHGLFGKRSCSNRHNLAREINVFMSDPT